MYYRAAAPHIWQGQVRADKEQVSFYELALCEFDGASRLTLHFLRFSGEFISEVLDGFGDMMRGRGDQICGNDDESSLFDGNHLTKNWIGFEECLKA